MGRMSGETVTLITRVQNGVDEGNDPIWQDSRPEPVSGVLIAPGEQGNASQSTRPDGIEVAYTLYFPRAWTYRSLRGATIRIDGQPYAVIGDPRPYRPGMSPTRWCLVVQVRAQRG